MRLPIVVLAACGGSSVPVTHDAAPCVPISGEYVDWDSSDAQFCGVFDAVWTVRGEPAITDHTNPNGRIELCVDAGTRSIVEIAPPARPAECVGGSYGAAGIVVIDPDVIAGGAELSTRAYTGARRDTFFTAAGLVYDPAKAQLFVHVTGAAGAVSIEASHAAPQAFDGSAWAAGDRGAAVFFPNVDGDRTAVTIAGATTTDVELAADTITYVMVKVP